MYSILKNWTLITAIFLANVVNRGVGGVGKNLYIHTHINSGNTVKHAIKWNEIFTSIFITKCMCMHLE